MLSDGSVFEQWSDSSPDREENGKSGANGQVDAKKKEKEHLEALKWEELRLKFKYEELLSVEPQVGAGEKEEKEN